jgi:hypothetical protein
MTYYTEDGEGDEITVHSVQDVQPFIDHATRVRNSGVADKGIKRDVWKYCTIPTHVELALRDKGINIYKKEDQKAMLKEINTNYPYLKYTRLHHE